MRDIPDDNLKYPVLIEGTKGYGSGFYLNKDDESHYLVTARHVLFQEKDGEELILLSNKIKVSSYSNDLDDQCIAFDIDLEKVEVKASKENDIVVVKIGHLKEITDKGKVLEFEDGVKALGPSGRLLFVRSDNLKRYDDVLISNEVFIFGYPNSLSFNDAPQIDYKRPLLRKGIIAGKNNAKKTIILDCPVYFGNSGGVAIEVETIALGQKNYKIIGVVSQYIPFVDNLKSLRLGYINTTMENSGYSVVVPTDTILDLINS